MNAKEKIADLTKQIKSFYKGMNEDNKNALIRLNSMKAHLKGIIENPTDYKNVDVEDVKGDLADVKGDLADVKGDLADVKGDLADVEKHYKYYRIYKGYE